MADEHDDIQAPAAERPARRSPPGAPAKRFRVVRGIVYGTDPRAPRERREWVKLQPGDVIDADRPGLDYAWCLRDGCLAEEVTG